MKKDKMKIPKNFGEALSNVLFDESDQRIYNFTIDFCNDHPDVKQELKNILKETARIQDEELRGMVEYYIKFLPDYFTKCLLMIGFVLGQYYEVPDPKVQKDVDFAWAIMKEWGLFSIYPKHKKAA